MASGRVDEATANSIAYSAPIEDLNTKVVRKAKRKVSKYQKRFGQELKKLKKAHPRTKVQNLMKRAHRATKKALK